LIVFTYSHIAPFYGTIHHGAEHTTYQAGYLPDNEVFSRPEFLLNAVLRRFHVGFGAGSVLTVRRRHGLVHVFKPSPTIVLNRRMVVFEAHQGVKTMTILTPELGTQSPTSRKSAAKATPNPTYCPRCNESELFCFCCGIELPKSGTLFAKQAKALEVKRIKRGTFLFTFGGAK
jgi:hypothetical protein